MGHRARRIPRPGVLSSRIRSPPGRTSLLPMYQRTAAACALAGFASICCCALGSAAPIPTPIGAGPRFHPAAAPAAVSAGRPVGGLRCGRAGRVVRAHVEVFARGRVVVVPAHIGISRLRRCAYPVRTTEPTGVVEFDRESRPTLADFFAVWGQRLSSRRLCGFAGRVRAYVDGVRRRGALSNIRLRRHAEIVLEVGKPIPPHRLFLFGRGR